MSSLDFLHGIDIVEIDDGIRPIQTAKSSIIGLVGTAGIGSVNVPGLVAGSPRDAVLQYGVYRDDGFTIPMAFQGIFDQIGAMVVVVNVCDPSKHISQQANETFTFALDTTAQFQHGYNTDVVLGENLACVAYVAQNASPINAPKTIAMPAGVNIVSVKSPDGTQTYTLNTDYTVANNTITVKSGAGMDSAINGSQFLVAYTADLVLNTDYTVDVQAGVITRVIGGKIMPQSSAQVSYTFVDPTKVTDADIIGGVNEQGQYTGLYALYSSETLWEVTPRILIAPGWTHQKANAVTANPVVSELLAVATRLRSIIFADAPGTGDSAAIQYREDWGSDRIMVVEPFLNTPGPYGSGFEKDGVTPWLVPSSIYWAGATAKMDNSVGFWASPSNQELSGVIGLGRTIDFSLGDSNCRANYLNSEQVSVVIRSNGFRTWGNHTSDDPSSDFTFLCVRRTADIIEDSIAASSIWAIDQVINTSFFTSLVGSVNAYLRYLKAVGAILGGHAWADATLNSDTVIASGHAYVDFDFTAPFPAEHITFRAHIVDDYIANIFAGLAIDITNASPTLDSASGTNIGSNVVQAS